MCFYAKLVMFGVYIDSASYIAAHYRMFYCVTIMRYLSRQETATLRHEVQCCISLLILNKKGRILCKTTMHT